MFINHLSVAERGDGMMEPHTLPLPLSYTWVYSRSNTHQLSCEVGLVFLFPAACKCAHLL